MRIALLTAAAMLIATGFDAPADAKTVKLGKHSYSDIEKHCTDAGGDLIGDTNHYTCFNNCSGGVCIVDCKKGKRCTGTTPSARADLSQDRNQISRVLTNRLPRR